MADFPQFPGRVRLNLDGLWDFCWGGAAMDWGSLGLPEGGWGTAAVPGVFDMGVDTAGRRGTGFYRRRIRWTAADPQARVTVGGLGLRGKIFWDGKVIGETSLAYSGVSFDFEVGGPGEHDLVIAVDNRMPARPSELFHPDYDFYGHGGIYRSVKLESLPLRRLERAVIRTEDLDSRLLAVTLFVQGANDDWVEALVRFDGGAPQAVSGRIENGRLVARLPFAEGQIWSPEAPHLHRIEVEALGDRVVEQFGIRTVEARAGRIFLNGKAVFLRGMNRHEAHPHLGPALPASVVVDDLEMLKDLGCNFIRGAHYPASQTFLELCDRMGFLVWEEALGWGDTEDRLADPLFAERQEAQVRAMVRNSINHPSVIIWAFLNEGCSHLPSSRPLYERLAAAIREEDPTRLVSFASNHATPGEAYTITRERRDFPLVVEERHFDLVDVISVNLYPAWMTDIDWETLDPLDKVKRRIEDFAVHCGRAGLKDKPAILSEIGAAALAGWHDRLGAAWTEDYQARLVAAAIEAVASQPRLSGLAIWQFCDCRSFSTGGVVRKARGFNNGGIVDEHRRPKAAYAAVRQAFSALQAVPPAWTRGEQDPA